MKVLRFAQFIANSKVPEFNRNKSGYGRSVWDICRHSAKLGNEEYLYTYGNKIERKLEDVNILNGNHQEVYKHFDLITAIITLRMVFISLFFRGSSFKARVACLIYSTKYGYITYLIKKINPDIIHIHGMTYWTLPFILAARKSKIPFVVTLHGLNMNVMKDKIGRRFEVEQINKLNADGVFITLIGSGMLSTITANCRIVNIDKLVIINHGMDGSTFSFDNDAYKIRQELGVSDKKVILSVGSLSERRNQISLIKAVSLMKEEQKKNIMVFIVGDGPMKSTLIQEIEKNRLNSNVELLGNKDHNELSKLYCISNLTCVLSKVEGFGRPILESFLFGVPVLAFEDLDAVMDLYEEGCLHLIKVRTEEAIKNGILDVLNKEKNSEKIINHVSTKTWDSAAKAYLIIYNKAMDSKRNKSIARKKHD